jgi:rhodanese-related sulfurtransferase
LNNIAIEKLIKKLETEKINIIDIREPIEYQLGRIPTALNIDKYALIKYPEMYIQKGKIYYIYCNSGVLSNRVVNQLNTQGYSTVNINGGYNNYLLRK